jgi:hypothetical protein
VLDMKQRTDDQHQVDLLAENGTLRQKVTALMWRPPMLRTLFASAAIFVVAAGPALAQVVSSEPITPAERAQVRRDWNEMAREWEQRQRRTYGAPQGSMVASGGIGGGASPIPSRGASPPAGRAPVPSIIAGQDYESPQLQTPEAPGSGGGASPTSSRGALPTPSGAPTAMPPQPDYAPWPGGSGTAPAATTQGRRPNLPDRDSIVALTVGPMGWANNVVGVMVDITNTSRAPIASIVLTCAFSEAGHVLATSRERVAALRADERVRITTIADVGGQLVDAVLCRAE